MTMTINEPTNMVFLINDFVILENICNLNCRYCHIKKVPYKRLKNELYINGEKIDIVKILLNVDNILRQQNEMMDLPILKISGGEISIIPEIINVIKKYEKKYEVIQVLTNNYLPSCDFYDAMSSMENIHFQISLDGHLFEMNRCRFLNKRQFNQTLENLKILIRNYKFPLEINCVLTNANYWGIIDYIEWLSEFNRNDLKLNIFPVNNCKKLFPPKECIPILEKIISNYENYSSILLPRTYMKELVNFINCGKRVSNCLVPYAVIGTYDTGKLDMCACSPDLPTLGNILQDFDESNSISSCDFVYQNILKNSPHYGACINCYTPYEILSLYFKSLISDDEMKTIPFYRAEKTLNRLKLIKSNIFLQSSNEI